MKQVKDLEFTGERFVPGIEDAELTMEHYQRYNSVVQLVKDKVVVDAACGEGYGTNILAQVAKSVTGVDISEEAVKHAKAKYGDRENITFLCESIAELSIPEKSVDVFVSFETLEHISEDLQKVFIKNVAKILKPDGILIISTPNKKVYSDERNYHNEYHVHEFYHDEFVDFLKSEFSHYKIFHQMFDVMSIIDAEGTETRKVEYRRNPNNKLDGKYYIAIASQRTVENLELGYLYFDNSGELQNRINRILQLQEEEEDRNKHIFKLDKEIEEKDRLIEYFKEAEYKANVLVDELNTESEEKDAKIAKLQDATTLLKKEIERKVEIIKRTKAEKEALANDLQKQIERTNASNGDVYSVAYVEDLKQSLNEKNARIEALLEIEREWENEKNSRAYKKILRRRARVNKLLPKNSKRRFVFDVAYKCATDPATMTMMISPHKIKTFFKVLQKGGMGAVNSIFNENLSVATAKAHPETMSLIAGLEPVKEIYSLEDFEKLTFIKWNNPVVSIVIPVFNEFNYTYNCLKSILKNSGEIKYEVIIANDCSTDCTSEVESIAENVRLITTEKNCRFLLNCNNAAKYARGKYILFLNNDTQVRPNWLQPLLDLIESDEKIGMVGSKLIYPDGKLQEAGGILWKDGSAWNYGHRGDAEASEFNYVKETDYISGAAIMIKSSLWNEIGGFDELFVPAYCEDSDLAFEVRKHGYKVMYQPKSVVVHFEGVSNGTDVNSGLKSYQVENSKKFYEKWKDVLEAEHFENAQNVFQARDKSAKKKCILFIDHYVPQFDKDAGSRTVFAYLKLFVNKGFNVKFLGDNFYRDEPYTEILQQMGIEVLYGPYYAQNWKQWIKDNAQAFDYVFMNRPHISKNYMDYVRETTKAKIIYYGHDLHYVREKREYELTKNKDLLKSSEEWKHLEYDLMRKADMVYYPSQVEIDEIASVDSSIKAAALTAYIYPDLTVKSFDSSSRSNILFVGGFGHGPNVDAVKWFVKEIFPKILEKNPDIVFEIVGSKAPDEITNLASKNIIVHGFVSDEKLAQLYSECKMTVIPLRYGAGIKGKVVEAMSQGVPVVTTSVGAEGILNSEDILFVEDNPDKFADLVCKLYNDSEALSQASSKSYDYIKKYYSEDAAWNVIKSEFE